jgi:hypothetical protein
MAGGKCEQQHEHYSGRLARRANSFVAASPCLDQTRTREWARHEDGSLGASLNLKAQCKQERLLDVMPAFIVQCCYPWSNQRPIHGRPRTCVDKGTTGISESDPITLALPNTRTGRRWSGAPKRNHRISPRPITGSRPLRLHRWGLVDHAKPSLATAVSGSLPTALLLSGRRTRAKLALADLRVAGWGYRVQLCFRGAFRLQSVDSWSSF